MVSAVLIGKAGALAGPADTPATRPAEWALPDPIQVRPYRLVVSPDGRYVFLTGSSPPRPGGVAPRRMGMGMATTTWMFDMRAGTLTDMNQRLTEQAPKYIFDVDMCQPSPNGKYVLIIARKAPTERPAPGIMPFRMQIKAYVMTMDSGEIQWIGDMPSGGVVVWIGNKVAMKREDHSKIEKTYGKLFLVDPEDYSTTDLEISGNVRVGHPSAKLLVCQCDPNDPAARVSGAPLPAAPMVLLTTEGRVIRQLSERSSGIGTPVLSDNGKYVAFEIRPPGRSRSTKGNRIRLFTQSEETDFTFQDRSTPIAVTYDGGVITFGKRGGARGNPVKIWYGPKKSRTLVKGALSATVAANQLFYMPAGQETPVLRAIPLRKKPTVPEGLFAEGPQSQAKGIQRFERLPPLDPEQLELDGAEDWQKRDFKDEKLKIAIVVTEYDQGPEDADTPESPRRGNPFQSEIAEDAAGSHPRRQRWHTDGSASYTRVGNRRIGTDAKLYMRYDLDTFEAVIRDRDYVLWPRYAALRDMYDFGFSPEKQLELITCASADRRSAMRTMAMHKATEYAFQEKAVPLYVRALSDPTLKVASIAASSLEHFFDLRRPAGKERPRFRRGGGWGGAGARLRREEQDVVRVAESVHAIRPDLITEADLEIIRTRERGR